MQLYQEYSGYKFQIRSMQLITRHPGAMQGSKEVDEHGDNGIRKLHDTLQESKQTFNGSKISVSSTEKT